MKFMSKISKIGIYELVAVFLSGILIYTFSIYIFERFFKMSIKVDSTIKYCILGYFIGIVFQEVGAWTQRIVFKDNKLLKLAWTVKNDSHLYMTEYEKEKVYLHVKKKLKLPAKENNDNIIYNYCKNHIRIIGASQQIDREQSIAGMARSLAIYFAIQFIVTLCGTILNVNKINVGLTIASALVTMLMFHRYIRFTEQRYIHILRDFYYTIIARK